MKFLSSNKGSAAVIVSALVAILVLGLVVSFPSKKDSLAVSYDHAENVAEIFATLIQDAYSYGTLYRPNQPFSKLTDADLAVCSSPKGQAVEKSFEDSSGKTHKFCFKPGLVAESLVRVVGNDICIKPQVNNLGQFWYCLDLSAAKFKVEPFVPPVTTFFWPQLLLKPAHAQEIVASPVTLSAVSHPLKRYCNQKNNSLGANQYVTRCLEVQFRVCEFNQDSQVCSGSASEYLKQSIVLIN